MEAVGAAGAIVGLAGSALTGLKSLSEFIAVLQDGKIDLDTTHQRLVEHEFRLSELETEYDSLPNGSITTEEKSLLDECIKGSHKEVKRYKTLLAKATKTRTKQKNFRRVEAALRMYLREEDLKKHRLLLQDRTLRLQEFSERSYRIRVGESIQFVVSSAAIHHADNVTAHTRTKNAIQALSDNIENRFQESLSTAPALEAQLTTIVGSYREQTQTLIQTTQLSTIQALNEMMRQDILPAIKSRLNETQDSDQRGARSQNLGQNDLCADEYGVSHNTVHTVYRTPLGRLHVLYSRKYGRAGSANEGKIGSAFWIRFDPYRYFSKNFVEWKLFLNTTCTGPPSTLRCNVRTLCEDGEVIDALGLIPQHNGCSHGTTSAVGGVGQTHVCWIVGWQTKPPDCRKLTRLLNERRFSHGDSLRQISGTISKLLTVFVRAHVFCERPRQQLLNQKIGNHEPCFSEAHHLLVNGHPELIRHGMRNLVSQKSAKDFKYLSQFYPAFYETLKLLLEIGCQPNHDDWSDLMSKVTRQTCHVMESHTQYASTDYFQLNSTIRLIRTAAKNALATECFLLETFRHSPTSMQSGEVLWWHGGQSLETHIGNLLPYKCLSRELEETIFDIGGVDVLNERLKYDRWLLVLMSCMQPRLRTLVSASANNHNSASTWDFSIERTSKEIENAPIDVKRKVAEYVVFHGNLQLLKVLVQKGFPPSLLLGAAARRGNSEILDFVLDSSQDEEQALEWAGFIHHHCITPRITQDPVLRNRLVEKLIFPARQASQQSQGFDGFLINPLGYSFLGFDINIYRLMQTTPAELPKYISGITDACISRYNEEHYRFLGGIRVYILCGLFVQQDQRMFFVSDHERKKSFTECEIERRSIRAFHHILQQLIASPAFGCGLEHVPSDSPYDQEPGTEGYTPLMLALYGGMVSTVKILVDAGAQITSTTSCGRSPLQLAQQNAQTKDWRACSLVHPWPLPWPESSFHLVPPGTDEEMLQILQDALCSRGEEVPDLSLPQQHLVEPTPQNELKVFWRLWKRIEFFLRWLFSPNIYMTMEHVGERLSYIAVVFTVAFFSIVQLVRLNINDGVANGILRLLFRPVVLIFVTAWIIRASWRQYSTWPGLDEGPPQ